MLKNLYLKLCFNPHLSILRYFSFGQHMSKYGLQLSEHIFLAQQYVFLWPILYCSFVALAFPYHSNSLLSKLYNFFSFSLNESPQPLYVLTC